jgi:hypothetical protein
VTNNSADMLALGSAVGGLGRQRGGRLNRLHRDFIPSPGELSPGRGEVS